MRCINCGGQYFSELKECPHCKGKTLPEMGKPKKVEGKGK